jgi:hypothetical protein
MSSGRRSPALLVTGIALLLSLVVTFPLGLHLSTAIYGGPGDATGTISVLWWFSYAIHHGLSVFDNRMLGAPLGSGWELIPFNVLYVAVFAPLSIAVGPTAAYNLGVLSSFPLTALATYLLARRLGMTVLGAALAALAFTFVPFHVEKAMGHVAQTHMEFFAFTLLFLVRWRQGGSRWNLAGAGAFIGLQLWTDFYFAFILLFGVAAFMVASLIWSPGELAHRRALLAHVAAAGILGVTVAAFVPAAAIFAHRPSSGSYGSAVASSLGVYTRSLAEIEIYSARPREYVEPWHANPLLPQAIRDWEIRHLHGSNFTEQSLFLGYTIIALAVLSLVVARGALGTWLGVILVAMGVVMALPPQLTFHGSHPFGPSYLLNSVVPFFRVYSRFGVLALLGATLMAGIGFTAFQGWVKSRRLGWLAAAPFVLLALEFNNQPPSHVTTIFPAPAEYQWLRTQPAGIVIEYPLASGSPQRQEIQSRQYVLYQQVHEHPLFNGAHPQSRAGLLAPKLEPLDGIGVVDQLKALGIRYVFVHVSDVEQNGSSVSTQVSGLQFVGSYDGTDVFLVE